MTIFKHGEHPMSPADPHTFAGAAKTQRLAHVEEGLPTAVYRVEFGDGGRTNWHTHSGPQWLLVIDGRIRVQAWGESPQDVECGGAVMIPPGEKHWHGAAPGSHGTHFAVNVDATTDWGERVETTEELGNWGT